MIERMIEHMRIAIFNKDEFAMTVIYNRMILLEGEKKALELFKFCIDEETIKK